MSTISWIIYPSSCVTGIVSMLKMRGLRASFSGRETLITIPVYKITRDSEASGIFFRFRPFERFGRDNRSGVTTKNQKNLLLLSTACGGSVNPIGFRARSYRRACLLSDDPRGGYEIRINRR